MSGIEVIGRYYYGCFQIRGKLLNVKDISINKIMKNNEICNLMKILN